MNIKGNGAPGRGRSSAKTLRGKLFFVFLGQQAEEEERGEMRPNGLLGDRSHRIF